MGMLSKEQPTVDIHDFHRDEVFNKTITREQSKTAFFAWLYGAKKMNRVPREKNSNRFYDKEKVVQSIGTVQTVLTPLGKVIKMWTSTTP